MTYPMFRTLAQVRKAFNGCWTIKHFVIEDGSKWNPSCACCKRQVWDFTGVDIDGKPMHPTGYAGNRCEYNPKTKAVKAMHYTCAWGRTLDQVATMNRR